MEKPTDVVTDVVTGVMPPEPFGAAKRRIAEAIWRHREEILDLAHRIHAHPELAFEEARASAWIAETVARHGYRVEHPAGRLKTAVRAVRPGGRGEGGPRISVLAEYDALPDLGHGCGHNLMAASGVGAAIGLAAVADDVAGAVVFLGTPAEERGSGKQFMIDDGLFQGIDAAIMFHPSDRSHAEKRVLACEDIDVVFTGQAAHAAAEPWKGRNALDALILLFNGIALWRQQLRPDARVHGVILDGGAAANVIPARTAARFMIRSPSDADMATMRERFRALIEAAAGATGCSHETSFSGLSSTMRNNPVLAERFALHMAAYGLPGGPPDTQIGSTDMGNVSQVCPTIHPSLAICERGVPKHSIAFRELARTPRADEVTLVAATLVAQVAYELLADPPRVAAAWQAFHAAENTP
jgi:amidohydrolase